MSDATPMERLRDQLAREFRATNPSAWLKDAEPLIKDCMRNVPERLRHGFKGHASSGELVALTLLWTPWDEPDQTDEILGMYSPADPYTRGGGKGCQFGPGPRIRSAKPGALVPTICKTEEEFVDHLISVVRLLVNCELKFTPD